MEFVGKLVQKEFKGYGFFSGIVQSYDASSGFFEVVYEDGDSEELDFSEVASLLQRKEADPDEYKQRLGRKPKKRRRIEPRKREDRGGVEESGNSVSHSQEIAETLGRRIAVLVEANEKFDMNQAVDLNNGFVGNLRDVDRANGNFGHMTVDLNEAVEKRSGVLETSRETGSVNGSLNENSPMKETLDLNAGFNINLNEGFDLNEEGDISSNCLGNLKNRECIDLNLDVNGNVNEDLGDADLGINHTESLKKECGFDLNLGIDEEIKDDADDDCGGEAKDSASYEFITEETQKVERSYNEGAIAHGTLQEVRVANDSNVPLPTRIWKDTISGQDFRVGDSVEMQDAEIIKEDSPEVVDGNQGDMRSDNNEGSGGRRRRGRRRRSIASSLKSAPETTVSTDATVIYANEDEIRSVYQEWNGSQRRLRRGKFADTPTSTPETIIIGHADVKEDCTMVTDGEQGDVGSTYKEVTGSCRKRRKFSDHVNATPQVTMLRRSTRRGSAKNDISVTTALSGVHDLSVSPADSALTEEKPVKSCFGWPEEPMVLPPRVQLPPSSKNLDLHGISTIDFFSIYACLRSFSTLLFLSPFELEEFLAALRCNSPSSLFDCIHVSILQTLRSHLEYLSNEGSESASICLRSLDWGLLDLITWPVFMVEYLLIHGSDLKPWLNLNQLKLLITDYHKQPVSVKVEILRCLCDDMIEVEAIRSELNRRSSGAETDLDFDRSAGLGAFKKKRAGMDISAGSCLTDEAVDDTTDWNSDECYLCKMDGSLICCDGCPAAFHSKCVGVDNDSLPEGDWFCPECAINRHKPWMKPQKSLRGAEQLGVDPYGRLYFSSCDYLLVSDSCETESSCNYYHRDALIAVIKVLRSSEMVYSSILEAIHKHWDIPVNLYGASGNLDLSLDSCMRPTVLASSETCTIKNEATDERKPEEKFVTGCSGNIHFEMSKSLSQTCVSSEGSAETTQTSLQNQNFQKEGPDCSNRSANFLNESDIPGNVAPLGDNSLTSSCLDLKSKNLIGSAANGHHSSAFEPTNGNTSQEQLGTGYMNYYSFGCIASSIAEELLHKSSDKTIEGSLKTDEEIVSAQMKIISKKTAKFCWSNIPRQNVGLLKEKCGWCFTCRISSEELGCLFNMCLNPVQKGPVDDITGLQSRRNKKGHLTDIINHIVLIEDRLHGLLSGPWLNPHYSRLWRKSVLNTSNIVSVKHLLLLLESNLHRLALSAEWLKHVDSASTMGSASHIIMASSRASSKNGIGRKRARYSEFDSNPSSSSASGLGMLWWRGGRLSRRLFNWKVLPRFLASKAARQVGCMKIPGILYPENSEFAKRSKYVCWRAAVESSTTVEQLALLVRELDSNIRWDEIRNTNPLAMVDKEFKKSSRLFKKVIVRRKCIEGEGAKYLLDFGKRKIMPEVVLKNGSMVEESSSERKKYWLNESYIPLYLLRSFEEKRIARQSTKTCSGKLSDAVIAVQKSSKKEGFSYLFAKAERSEYHQCGHCNKDVPIREAVLCQYCNGFFHRRHVRKSTDSITAECMYTCYRCRDGKYVKIDSQTGKNDVKRGKNNKKNMQVQHQKSKKASVSCRSGRPKNSKKASSCSWSLRSKKNKKVAAVVPLRRSPRKVKYNFSQNKKVRGRKKGKQVKSRKGTYKKPTKVTSWRKERAETCSSYWINGLRLSRKPDDERVMQFKSGSFLASSKSDILDQPKCHLCCEDGYTSTLNYISCEMCGEWFHGDAFGLNTENINKIIGFRCHMCRKSTPPVCPLVPTTRRRVSQKDEVQNDVQNELPDEETSDVAHLGEMLQNDVQNELPEETTNVPHLSSSQESLIKEDHQGSVTVNEFALRKQQSGTIDSDQSSAPGSRFEMGNGQAVDYVQENTGAAQICNRNLNTQVISCSGSHLPRDNAIEPGDVMVTSSDQMQTSSCDIDLELRKTELEPLGCDQIIDSLTPSEVIN